MPAPLGPLNLDAREQRTVAIETFYGVQVQTHADDLTFHLPHPREHIRMQRVGNYKFGHGFVDDCIKFVAALQYPRSVHSESVFTNAYMIDSPTDSPAIHIHLLKLLQVFPFTL